MPTANSRYRTPLSGQLALLYESEGIAAAEGLPIKTIGTVEPDFGFLGQSVGPLGGAEEDIHPLRSGHTVRVRDDDRRVRPCLAKVIGLDVPRLHASAGVWVRSLRASLASPSFSALV